MTKIIEPVITTVDNFNPLSPNKFLVVINRFKPLSFFAQEIVLPSVILGQNRMPTNRSITYSTPGDTVEYDDLMISFIVDEDLVAYKQLKDWEEEMAGTEIPEERFSDLSILLLTNNSNKNHTFKFYNTWPHTIGNIGLSVAQAEDAPVTVDVTFKHSKFEIESV
jgi:hypothetical protein